MSLQARQGMMADTQWYYAANGQQHGPVTLAELRQFLSSGQVPPSSLVWREGMGDWQPAQVLSEFASSTNAQTLPPPSSPAAPAAPQAPDYSAQPTPANYASQPLPYGKTGSCQGMATAAFVISLVGLACGGFLLGIIAIVLSTVAHNDMKRSANTQGKGLATAALIIGIVDVAKSLRFGFLFGHHFHWFL
jgi:uncharacterized protein DUF4339/uncharacterized protein DUF4190